MSKNRGGGCIFSHLNFSSRVPREVTDKAWMNSENSMRPSYRVTKRREREREWERRKGPEKRRASYFNCCSCSFINSLLFFHDALDVFCWKRGQTIASSQMLFLPCTWLSPQEEICHLWSWVRWMLPAHSLKVTAQKQLLYIWGKDVSHVSSDSTSWMGMEEGWRQFCPTK